MPLKRLVLLITIVALPACDENPDGSGNSCTSTATKVCAVPGNAFLPATLIVDAGTTVIWENGDGAAHTVTSDAGSGETFDFNLGSRGASRSRQFNAIGSFHYHCRFHGADGTGMHGTITVK